MCAVEGIRQHAGNRCEEDSHKPPGTRQNIAQTSRSPQFTPSPSENGCLLHELRVAELFCSTGLSYLPSLFPRSASEISRLPRLPSLRFHAVAAPGWWRSFAYRRLPHLHSTRQFHRLRQTPVADVMLRSRSLMICATMRMRCCCARAMPITTALRNVQPLQQFVEQATMKIQRTGTPRYIILRSHGEDNQVHA